MIKKIKNIFNLTKIISKNSFQNPYLIDKKTNKINKKSVILLMSIILAITITYVSYEIIKELNKINQASLFLEIFLPLLMIIMFFQVILSSTNVYYFSRDFDILLPLPIKPEELLISKFNTILFNLYFFEGLFSVIPLIIYGIITGVNILYYLKLIIILFVFPIMPVLIVSIIIMFLIKLSKFIKNKDIFQIIITTIFMFFIFILEFYIGNFAINKIDNNVNLQEQEVALEFNNFNNKIKNINKYFLQINSSINFLINRDEGKIILELLNIIFIDIIFFGIFIFIGKRYYLKNILKNNNKYYLKNFNKFVDDKKIKKINYGRAYIKKEFKLLFKNPIFFMQCVFPELILVISIFIMSIVAVPNVRTLLTFDLSETEINFSVTLGTICLCVGIIQIISTLSNISITAVSRDGKNAEYIMKSIPIDYYKQFVYKTKPQIYVNFLLSIACLLLIKLVLPEFKFIHLLFILVIYNLINIINSILMVLVDLLKPNLNWNSEYEIFKQSNNKLFQYVFTIMIILLLVYFKRLFYKINLNISCSLIIIILILLLLIINKIIKLNIDKFYKKIK